MLRVEGDILGLDHDLAGFLRHRVARIDDEIEKADSNCTGSIRQGSSVGLRAKSISTASSTARRSNSPISLIRRLGLMISGRKAWRRAKARRDCVNLAPREAARCIVAISRLPGIGRHLPRQQIEIADDHGQDVVEVVGDPAGQLSDRFEPLRFAQLFFRRRAFFRLVLRLCQGSLLTLGMTDGATA